MLHNCVQNIQNQRTYWILAENVHVTGALLKEKLNIYKMNVLKLLVSGCYLVSGCEATHCRSARALHTLLDWWAVSVGGLIDG